MNESFDTENTAPQSPLGEAPPTADSANRRDFLATASHWVMAGGLLAGYGTLVAMAGKFLHQTSDDNAWLFVAPASEMKPGGSIEFESPIGVRVVVTRNSASPPDRPLAADDFLALSSVCPHLGCRVHWESQNNRFFCPCHNGAFDPQGKATAGPPLAAGQSLPKYPLKVEYGLLFIEMPIRSVGAPPRRPMDERLSAACRQQPRGDA